MAKKLLNIEENGMPDAAQIAEWKAKFGRLSLLEREGGYAVVRHPKPADIEMLVGKVRDLARTMPAGEKLKPWAAMRMAYPMLKVYETKGFLENADNEAFVYDRLEQFVSVPSGNVVEL